MSTEQPAAAGVFALDLPWPAAALSPNARGHWARKARAAKKARATAHQAGWAAGLHKVKASALRLATTFFPPTRGRYDDDNLQARCKAYFDGIADCIGVDDQHFRHAPVQRGEPRKLGAVRIEIEVLA